MTDQRTSGPGDGVDGEIATVLAQALDLIGEGSHDAALGLLVPALEKATQAGFSSAFLHWAMSLAAHGRQDLRAAMEHTLLALKLDPAAPVMLDSYRDIVSNVRAYLADPVLDPADERVQVLFDLLEKVGAEDAHAIFTFGLHHVAHGRLGVAAALAERLLDLEPKAPEVVRYVATLYRGMGNAERAKEYEALVRVLEAEKNVLPFAGRRARS